MINVLAELERIGWSFEWASENEIRTRCPFHADHSPSCHVNVKKRVFKCQTAGCGADGDFISFLARCLDTTRAVVYADLSTRYNLTDVKVIEAETVERYHQNIWKSPLFLEELHKRGVTDELIRRYRLGEHQGRITIPIKNESGLFVNIRRYLPGAPGRDKMRNAKGRGQIRLYPYEQLEYTTVVICAGELKAIVAASQLNRYSIGAICATAGEGNWDAKFTQLFKGKCVYVCYDIDDAGQKSAQIVLTQMHRYADWVGNVILPLDADKYPHGDINDYCGPEIRGSLKRLLNKVEEWTPIKKEQKDDETPIPLELSHASNAKYARKRVQVRAVVSAVDQAPYIIPKEVLCECDRSQNECAMCPVFLEEENVPFSISPENESILEMVGTTKGVQRESIMNALGVPKSCKVCDFAPLSFYNVEDTRVSPQLEITNRTADRVMQPAVLIGEGVELNESYKLTGRMHPHPKTQQSTLLISAYETTQDALSTYTPVDLDRLKLFRPKVWSVDSIREKLKQLYTDLEANVTRIYQRQALHLAVDLTYHSPLLLNFDGKTVKGWVETLILGDSSQGKSDTAIGLQEHYGLGAKVECKNASVAGLLGGLQQMGSKWFVTWGIVPTHDRRLVIFEEVKGASVEVIGKLTDMRSSGIAEIPKIEKRRTHARTRLLWISNPRSDKQLAAYNFGVEAIKELIGGPEDVRRFDLCYLASSRDVDPVHLNTLQRSRPSVKHVFTGELCRSLILYAWTRTEGQVLFDSEATKMILEGATDLSSQFTDRIPLIDRGSTRYKLARLAASLAARTFSTTDDLHVIYVRPAHVEFIVQFLQKTYSSATFGYEDYTQAMEITNTLLDPEKVKKQIKETPWPADFIKQILHRSYIELIDIQDWCSYDRVSAQELLSLLVRKHALTRERRAYRKTPSFIALLKKMLEEGDFPERPDFIEEEF